MREAVVESNRRWEGQCDTDGMCCSLAGQSTTVVGSVQDTLRDAVEAEVCFFGAMVARWMGMDG
jgi:hypothetical protein